MRTRAIWFGAIIMAAGVALAGAAGPSAHFDLPSQSLAISLKQFADQTGLQLAAMSSVVGEKKAPAVKGDFSAGEVLERLLRNSGLSYKFLDRRTVAILPAFKRNPNEEGGATSATQANLEDDIRLAQVKAAGEQGDQARKESALEEVVVTAQKRIERLQDVPVPVTALSGESLVNSNQLRLQDYYTRVPGLSVTLIGDESGPVLTIRGVTTGGATNPTVGIVVDDVPYGSSTVQGSNSTAPDIDPTDLARVEVLRGPQGTLYGAASMGGLLKFVTVDPSTDRLNGLLRAGTSSVRNSDNLGYNLSGAVNIPLSDALAIRASGFTRRDPGYIDDPVHNIADVNQGDADGGRLSALWQPSQDLSIKLSALLQDIKMGGSSQVYLQPGLGDLQQNALRGTGGFNKKVQAYNATATAKFGSIALTSVSGYSINRISTELDSTPLFGPLLGIFLPTSRFGVTGFADPAHSRTTKLTQEVRLSGPIGPRFDWLFGAFYTRESVRQGQDILAADLNTGAPIGSWFKSNIPTTFVEYAAFADLTAHVTDRFDIQIGGRQSHNKQTYASVLTGPLVPIFYAPEPLITPELHSNDNAFTYLVTPRFKLSRDLMVYARLASGYRPGGPNVGGAALSNLGLPPTYDADKTRNYEIGAKGNFIDHAVSFDASLYYIDWKRIQLLLLDPATFTSYNTNGSRAKSQGAELSFEFKPFKGLTLAAWATWNDAKLTADFPPTQGAKGSDGDRLPYSSRFSGNLSVDQEFSLPSDFTGFIGGSWSYVGDRVGIFQNTPVREIYPSYTKFDLRAGAVHDSWTVNLYINNVADQRGVLRGGRDSLVPYAFNYIQPRTVGLSLLKKF